METTEKSDKEKTSENKSNQTSSGGFDINSLLNNENLVEILKHLLSGGGAMAGTFLMWIKPLQDKIAELNKKIEEQDKQIKELKEDQRELEKNLSDDREPHPINGKDSEYFDISRNTKKDYAFEEMRRRRRKYV